MDSLYKNGRVRSYILIILIFASFIISVPLKRRVSTVVNNKIESFASEFYSQTGLHITYDTLSPSLLSNFFVKGINIVDDQNVQILSIDKTKINYHIFNLLRKDIQTGIASVVVDGINLDVAQVMNIIDRFKNNNSSSNFDFKKIRNMVPSNIKLKNINFVYADDNVDGSIVVKSVTVSNNIDDNNLDFQFDAQVNANVFALKRTITGKMELTGTIEDEIDNSRVNVKFSNLTDGNYKLNKLNLLVYYAKNTLEVHTIQTVNPIIVGADYHIDTGDVNLQINIDNFKPLTLLSVTSKQNELQKYQNIKITTDTIVKCNIKNRVFDYISDINANIPSSLIPGGLNAIVTAYGNQNESEITGIKISGEKCVMSGKFKYVYDTYQLSGLLEIPSFVLDNGNVISTEMYVDPLEKGFMVFSPQVFIGERALTALQLSMIPRSDSFDFAFEMSDYSHIENYEPGIVKIDGSYLPESNYVQSNITLTSLYLDSIAAIGEQIVDNKIAENIRSVKDNLTNYVFSGDVYASTDFKSISYNVPYLLFANSKKDNQLLMLSLNGTEQNLQVNQLSLIAGKYAAEMTGSLDKSPDSSDLFFTVDLKSDSVPYHFSGTIMPEVVNVTGDYGTDFEIRFDKKNNIDGYVNFESIPFSFSGTSVILSTNTVFNYANESGPSIQINHFEVEGTDTNSSVSPRFAFAGNVTKYGAQMNSVAYTDIYSALEGTADLMLNVNQGIFDSVGVMANLKNPMTEENINIDGNISNPDHLEFSVDNFLKYFYLNVQVIMKDLGLNRFALDKSDNNFITGSLNAFGTVEHPYVALNIEDLSYLISTEFLKGKGTLILEDKDFSIDNLAVFYDDLIIENINAKASLNDMKMEASANLEYSNGGKSLYAPLKLDVYDLIIPEGKLLPDTLTVTLSTPGFFGSLIKKEFPLSISATLQDRNFTFYSSKNAGIDGFYSMDGLLQLSVDNKKFLKFNMDGLVNTETCNIDLYDVDAALDLICQYINLDDFIIINKGNLSGEVVVTGTIVDPDFNGFASINSGEVILPWLTSQRLKVADMNFVFNHNEIEMQQTALTLKSGERVDIGFGFYMNKWSLDYIDGFVKTVGKELFPVKMSMPMAVLAGNVTVDLKLFMDMEHFEIDGNCFGENVKLSSNLSSITSMTQNFDDAIENTSIPMYVNLDVQLGTHAAVDFDPILRCVFVPNTKMNVKFDQANNYVAIDGELNLKSGDIAYLNRNFYIRSGTIDFSQSSIDNPIITINAETREKDSKGQTVKIIMDVEKQPLQSFEPRFSAIPGKSENEIRTMLGQIAVADSSSATNFLFAASDYALQSTLVRQAENKLRDFCNFDIFSVRTNVLQNTLNMGVSGELSKKNLSIGNFLDNTTVYIGKYLGSSLYLDAMLHVSFEDNVALNDIATPGKVLFQPEIGMELESPFANIRVNMTPDINALLNNQFVPSASVTLSWKIAY